ncbi:ADP-ribosylglycohydrolase family protein [Streptomyces sp. NPDC005483]|uniref:ADP-ribosylglycohydrolase family protein n=1 Tax=Streptomyces sp. NPDC005483 TaxID=3154882 RepID=UPI0033AE9D89
MGDSQGGAYSLLLRFAYQRWPDKARLYARRAPGNACLSGVPQLYAPDPWSAIDGEPGPVSPDSKGCGTVMRSAPSACARPPSGPSTWPPTAPRSPTATPPATWRVRCCARCACCGPEKVESLGAGWVAEEALAIAVYSALAADSVKHALLLSVNDSGDSDSTGSICGNLLGALHGDVGLPHEWVRQVEGLGQDRRARR